MQGAWIPFGDYHQSNIHNRMAATDRHYQQPIQTLNQTNNQTSNQTNDNLRTHHHNSEAVPFGSHKHPTLGDIDDDIGHAVFVSWISVAATFAGVAVVGLLVKPRTHIINVASDILLAVAISLIGWAMFVFFRFRQRHWTTFPLALILLLAIAGLIVLAFI